MMRYIQKMSTSRRCSEWEAPNDVCTRNPYLIGTNEHWAWCREAAVDAELNPRITVSEMNMALSRSGAEGNKP